METSIRDWRREIGFVKEVLDSGEIKVRAVAILKMEDINADLVAAIFSLASAKESPRKHCNRKNRFNSVKF